ncbi:MAG: hypothetical protein COA47_01830 [Robiginitomaculum sp.]|nr:MAG: hypothetical protein COA47_01830 [Robiginitomaculum sp.]
MKTSLFGSTGLAMLLFLAAPVWAADETESATAKEMNLALLARIEKLEAELAAVREAVQQSTAIATRAETNATKTAASVIKVKKFASAAADASYAGAPSDSKWHLAGYADVGFVGSNGPNADSFVTGKFNPSFHFQYKDKLIFESELEFLTTSDGKTEIELEYSQVDLFLNDNMTLVMGKFLSPIGQFQERLHPSWINRIQGAPAGFGHDGIQPASDTGFQLRGIIPLAKSKWTYAIAVGNGPRTNSEGGVAFEGVGRDDNRNKSVGGRVGFFPTPYLEIGGSYLTTRVNGYMGPGAPGLILGGPIDARYELWGFDASLTKGALAARVEYLSSNRDMLFSSTLEDPAGILLPELGMEAWYGQVSYRLSKIGDSDFIHKLEPVIRYGEFRISGQNELEEENAQNRLNIGLNYWLSPTIVTKAGLEWRDFTVAGVDSETLYQFQMAYGF